MQINISSEAKQAIKNFTIPEELGFGRVMAPVMLEANFENGKWSDMTIVPFGPISMLPTSKVLHYGQEIFEGLKSYRIKGNGPFLFRPDENAKRFNHSAKRMAMPEVPVENFVEAVKVFSKLCSEIIPRRSGESLYLRPFMFSTEEALGIKPSDTFKFMIVASPSGAYFSGGTISVLIERSAVRAAPGGTGNAKTGGNYAAALEAAIETKKLGHDQTLWLDAVTRKNVEEMSGMNFNCIIDGKLVTPALTDSILAGITRNSLLAIAPQLDIQVEEKKLSIDELIEAIKTGRCTEAFACGTAAIITPIHQIAEKDGTVYKLPSAPGPCSTSLRQALLDIQEGRREAPNKEWVLNLE
ncbi:MAG: branched chain amino acid aminotransferase [Bdellovibrionales bacterium CG12_big_fil_rev_8_21_14_0_65_38_15]|nr:MAG: branched chain amino acid aminotransferase [Bdellovibrionales bacterium CG22_combo_CG10-13_8_21_14_all_38_13]PIQ57081.1 MAG: branched chain amino acid aminotransferase [Bdellovibrionales bacterium CG12_big_fil_rev_8_21_14_0_65_38_15]PIR30111.1 MAG: branched chain amino acid aminotransferase [Bdellovibrionales bacterium CG11_big_fil_rev_8_21_14_0_20_38_13]